MRENRLSGLMRGGKMTDIGPRASHPIFPPTLRAPAKRASTRVKVPSVQLDGSAPQTVPTASPRGGVGSRHGVEPAGRNEHMNHINEPRKETPGSRAPQIRAKAAELEPGPTVVGFDKGPAGSAWATCRAVTHG